MNVAKNHLKNEKSPYLLQHVNNPVDWYPWSKEAFNKAQKEKKPIFLSIGYSTCHWCHVMAHESFEDTKVAELLNENFICIKVDREERPDIDKIYMNVCQIITGSGGWPLTIIMTPEKKPFFAATYIPKETRFGIKGLFTLIPEIKKFWENNNDELLKSAGEITKMLQRFSKTSDKSELSEKIFDLTFEQLFNSFDEIYGGFGIQPKFPTPHNLLFLLRYWKRTKDNYCLKMVENTLEKMRQGGIYDHIGFGFHRYSTDKKWILPHFEKMLFDQALLILAYIEAYQATKKTIFKKTAQEIIEYVFRDMTSKEGGFYSAEDADSDGMEGKYYIWDYDELKQVLSEEELDIVKKYYNIKKDGNFSNEMGNSEKKNIFYQTMDIDDFVDFYKLDKLDFLKKIEIIRKKLFDIRKKRKRPSKDDKILTDWNGLMIAALAKAGRIFNDKIYVEKAEKALNFILRNMRLKNGELLHRYRDGDAKIFGYADDYAFLIWGLIELYQTTFNSNYLKISLELNTFLIDHFWDKNNGGLFFISDKNEEILTRIKEVYDGAIPSANSVAMYNMIRLSRITGDLDLEDKARHIGEVFSAQISKMPVSYTQMLVGLDFIFGQSYEIIIVGDKDKKDTKKILKNINLSFLPNKILIFKDINSKDILIEKLAPFITDYYQKNNKATIYVCKNHNCQLPLTDIEKIKQILN